MSILAGAAASILALLSTSGDAPPGDLIALFDRICEESSEPPADFRTLAKVDLPVDLRIMNIYDHDGAFMRRDGPDPAFIVRTRGPGHWAGIEAYCSVAADGADFDAVVGAYARRLKTKPARFDRWGTANATVNRKKGPTLLITRSRKGWVSILTGGQVRREEGE